MTPLQKLIDKGRALREKATPGPWHWFGKSFKYLVGPKFTDVILQEIGPPEKGMLSPEKEDAEFLVFACNTQETLEQIIETAVETLKKIETISITDGCEECSSFWQREYGIKPVKQALKKIEEIAGKIE